MTNALRQSGSAFFIILIAIAMFGALSYALMRDSRTNSGQLTDQQARLAAQEIISYGDAIATAVQKLKLRGCSNEQISFDGHNGTSKLKDGTPYVYTHGSTPADGSCAVFNPNGGAVNPSLLSTGYADPNLVLTNIMHPQSFYVSAMRVMGIGSDDAGTAGSDLVLRVGRLQKNVCLRLNDLLGITNPAGLVPEDVSYCNNAPFTGTYQACAQAMSNTAPEIAGKTAFCSNSGSDEISRIYFKVLIAR